MKNLFVVFKDLHYMYRLDTMFFSHISTYINYPPFPMAKDSAPSSIFRLCQTDLLLQVRRDVYTALRYFVSLPYTFYIFAWLLYIQDVNQDITVGHIVQNHIAVRYKAILCVHS